MSNYPHAHTRGSRQGCTRPSLPPRGRAYGRIAMNPVWVHERGEITEEMGYGEDQPAGWENFGMAHSSQYSNMPINYTPQSSSTSSFPNTYSHFGSHTNPMPQFTFTTASMPSNVRGHIMQHEQTQQGHQPGAITRGFFTNAIESVQQTRRRSRRNPPPSVTTPSDREEQREYTPCSRTNNDNRKNGLMDQVCDTGVVMDLHDEEVQEEIGEIIDELLFKLKQVTEDRDRLVALKTAKKKHVISAEEKEQPPLKRIDRGPRTMGTFQITPSSSRGIGQGSQLSISVPPSIPPSSRDPSHDDRDIVMTESPVVASRQEYEDPVEITPAGELQGNDEPPCPTEPMTMLEQEDPFGLDKSDESEPETKRKKGKGKKKSAQEA